MTKTTIILVVVLLIGGALYWYTARDSQPEPTLSASAPLDPAEQQFIDLAGRLSAITFDTSIFSDPRLSALVNLATPITRENQGRPDPFAPLGR
jgi:hypothetical protein